MTCPEPGNMGDTGAAPLDGNSVTNFLQLGVERKNRPVDALIDRLQQVDGEAWLRSALESSPSPWFLSLEGSPSSDELEDFKQQAKTTFAKAEEEDERLAGLLRYLLVLAAGLNCHGSLISSQPGPEISATLLDLAVALSDPWNDYIAEAAMNSTGS